MDIRTSVLLALLPCILCLPLEPGKDHGMVVVTESSAPPVSSDEPSKPDQSLEITEMHIKSNITNRFSHTLVKSKVKNSGDKAQETVFFVVLPEEAFISGFIMQLGDKNYTAYVQEKEQAKKTYDQAVSSGMGAAHVAVSARDSNKFTVSINVEPASKAIFYLTYEELLQRKEGRYEQVINIHPKQLVKDLRAEVEIKEQRPLQFVSTPSIRSGNEISKESEDLAPEATVTRPNDKSAVVTFTPDHAKQKQIAHALGTKEDEGMAGQFIVQYDVERSPGGGEVLVKDGYFVHFFAPSELAPLNKHVVFVLDTSGSMWGRRIEQLKHAMKSILAELKPDDFFNLVEFSDEAKVWNLDAPEESTVYPTRSRNWYSNEPTPEEKLSDFSFPPAYPVNKDTIKKAEDAVTTMHETGGTNIFDALRVGMHLVKLRQQRTKAKIQPIVFFLTDGEPTVGKTDYKTIISGIAEENGAEIPIISLSFGTGADRKFLEKLSLANNGFARHIYEESDASLQLENFYKEVSSPLLSKVKFEYTPDTTSLTTTDFPILYRGSELVVTGKINDPEFKAVPYVSCFIYHDNMRFRPTVERAVGSLERLWAYKTVKKALDDKKTDESKAAEYEKKALDLALKFSFVTPVTSLVVVKPNATNAVDAETATGGPPRPNYGFAGAGGFAGPPGFGGGAANPMSGAYNPIAPMIPGSPASSLPFYHTASFPMKTHTLSARPTSHIDAYPDFDQDMLINLDNVSSLGPVETSTTETPEPATLPPQLKQKLPWLEEKLRVDGSLSFLKGIYKLGYNETSPADQHCTTPSSEEGQCKLIKDCEELHPKLTDVQSFKDNFCIIEKRLAGVCCPKKV